MNRLSPKLFLPILLFASPFLFVSCVTDPSSSGCAGTLHRVQVNVTESDVTVTPATLEVNGGDCVEFSATSGGAALDIERIEIEEPPASERYTRAVERTQTVRLPSGRRAYNVVVSGRPPSRLTNAPIIIIQCFPPMCSKPPAPIQMIINPAR